MTSSGGIIEAFARVIPREWLLILSGVVSVAAGIVIAVRPSVGALGIAIAIGVYALLFGATLIAVALHLRRIKASLAGGTSGHPRMPEAA